MSAPPLDAAANDAPLRRPPWVAGLRAGEPAAHEALYRAHARQVLGWCIRLGGPGVDAEDAAHLVFEAAIRSSGRYDGVCSPTTWLYGITRRVLANQRRRATFRRWFGLDEEREEAPDADPGGDRRRDVQRALASLRAEHREVLVLADLEERPAGEVAELVGVPVGTVYSRLFAARRAFASAWPELAEGGAPVVALRRAP